MATRKPSPHRCDGSHRFITDCSNMAPQTRSTAKSSPGRLTRNSIFGRSPLLPPKSRNDRSPVRAALARDTEVKCDGTSDVGHASKGIPWHVSQDADGVMTTIAVSETGEGIHVRWFYPDDDHKADEDGNADVEMTVDEERGVTPSTTVGPDGAACHPFPQTPMAPHPYDAGSVIRTPIKRARPLQRSPQRIGDKGVRCLYEQGGALREFNGGARVVFRHPVGSSANLSREQVEQWEKAREERIIRDQVDKLLAQKQRIEEEEKCFSDSGYEDEMETDMRSTQRIIKRESTNDTVLVSHSELSDTAPPVPSAADRVPGAFRGPNGELLDRHGNQMFGREGTILIDSTNAYPRMIKREAAFVMSTGIADGPPSDHCTSEAQGMQQTLFGPEGTELLD